MSKVSKQDKSTQRITIMDTLVSDLHLIRSKLEVPPFGGLLAEAPGQTCVDSLVIHRIVNKWSVPSPSDALSRRKLSIDDMLQRDAEPARYDTSSDYLRLANARLAVWLRDFRPSYAFRAPTGASHLAMEGGLTDILLKLSLSEQWEINPKLLKYAATICYRNRSLKRLVRSRFRRLYPYRAMNDLFRQKYGENGYRIFLEMFSSLCTLNGTARVTTVPKDNNRDRVISCEPLWSMICQLSFMTDLRAHMSRKTGFPLEQLGNWHGMLIRDPKRSTIDLSAASDHVKWSLVRRLWPRCVVSTLDKMRSEVFEIDGEYHAVSMFGPMGCGLTFDVMTYTIWALLGFDKSVTVFGDDILTRQPHRALLALKAAGLVVNRSKSFINSKFRESCGKYWHDDVGYILSYDFRYCESFTDWIVCINKLGMLLAANQVSAEIRCALGRAYNELSDTFPSAAFSGDEIALRSDTITGFPDRYVRKVTATVECWSLIHQRRVNGYISYSNKAKSLPDVTERNLALLGVLYRGDKTPRGRVTLHQDVCDTFSRSPLRLCPLYTILV